MSTDPLLPRPTSPEIEPADAPYARILDWVGGGADAAGRPERPERPGHPNHVCIDVKTAVTALEAASGGDPLRLPRSPPATIGRLALLTWKIRRRSAATRHALWLLLVLVAAALGLLAGASAAAMHGALGRDTAEQVWWISVALLVAVPLAACVAAHSVDTAQHLYARYYRARASLLD